MNTAKAEIVNQPVVRQLLEALQCVLENEASDHKAQEEFGGYVLDDDVRRVIIAAIAKATGAAPENDSPTTQKRID